METITAGAWVNLTRAPFELKKPRERIRPSRIFYLICSCNRSAHYILADCPAFLSVCRLFLRIEELDREIVLHYRAETLRPFLRVSIALDMQLLFLPSIRSAYAPKSLYGFLRKIQRGKFSQQDPKGKSEEFAFQPVES